MKYIGRRPMFFLAVAVIFAVMYPLNLPEFRWVNLIGGGLALFWAILLSIEVIAGRGRGERGAGLS